jgi:hypothetical protein
MQVYHFTSFRKPELPHSTAHSTSVGRDHSGFTRKENHFDLVLCYNSHNGGFWEFVGADDLSKAVCKNCDGKDCLHLATPIENRPCNRDNPAEV